MSVTGFFARCWRILKLPWKKSARCVFERPGRRRDPDAPALRVDGGPERDDLRALERDRALGRAGLRRPRPAAGERVEDLAADDPRDHGLGDRRADRRIGGVLAVGDPVLVAVGRGRVRGAAGRDRRRWRRDDGRDDPEGRRIAGVPRPSPSLSRWSGLATAAQLSVASGTPSPSLSGPGGKGVESQAFPMPVTVAVGLVGVRHRDAVVRRVGDAVVVAVDDDRERARRADALVAAVSAWRAWTVYVPSGQRRRVRHRPGTADPVGVQRAQRRLRDRGPRVDLRRSPSAHRRPERPPNRRRWASCPRAGCSQRARSP